MADLRDWTLIPRRGPEVLLRSLYVSLLDFLCSYMLYGVDILDNLWRPRSILNTDVLM